MPHVSVIIPLYNKRKYVARTLDSVFNQTFRDFEVIVVDDGSTDGSPEVVRRYDDARLRMIHQANAGPGAARNRGLAEANSPYVAFLDADDEWMPGYLERVLDVLKSYPACDAVAATLLLRTPETGLISSFEHMGLAEGLWNVDMCRNREDRSSVFCTCITSGVVCRLEVVQRYGGFYEKNRCVCGEDLYLWTQILFGHTIYRLAEPLAWYHRDASGLDMRPIGERELVPVLTDPDPIRRNCPTNRRDLVEITLAEYALRTAHMLAAIGDVKRATWIMEAFPSMRKLRWEFAKLRVKVAAPSLVPRVRRVTERLGSMKGVRQAESNASQMDERS
jgi:hypothetical protein